MREVVVDFPFEPVMAMMGEAFARNCRGSQLLGIAPAGKVTYPGGPNDSNIGDGAPLEQFDELGSFPGLDSIASNFYDHGEPPESI